MKKDNRNSQALLPVQVIQAASTGDPIAMTIVLSNYRNYISKLAMQQVYQTDRGMVMCVDEFMRGQLETKLMEKILVFDVTR